MSATSGNICYLVSVILLGYFLVRVQPREISQTKPRTREYRDEWEDREETFVGKHTQAGNINNRYFADLVELELRSASEVRNHPPVIKVQMLHGGDLSRVNSRSNDVDDNDPIFDKETYQFSIPENTTVGTTIAHVHATEADLYGEIIYDFAWQTTVAFGEMFGINEKTGDILLTGPVDFEEQNVFTLSVMAKNQIDKTLVAESTVVILVTDTNDNPPDIQIYTLTGTNDAAVAENAEPGTLVAYVSVHDPDSGENGEFTCGFNMPHFKLVVLYENVFEIVSTTKFEGEFGAEYKLMVQCEDLGDEPRIASEQLDVYIV